MKILFFDTETTGLPKDWKAPASDVDNWPRMIQIAFLVYVFNEVETLNEFTRIGGGVEIIRPDGFEIPEEVAKIHGISQARADEVGVPISSILPLLADQIFSADLIVGHNIAFDRKILGAEFHRHGIEDALEGKTKSCTMMNSAKYCALPRNKWPKLQELHNKLFGAEFEDAHDAAADIAATAKCYMELVVRGVMRNPRVEVETHRANKEAKDAREGLKV